MAFVTSGSDFNGDVVNTNYVLPIIAAQSIFIPGVTTPRDIVVNAETAYWKEFTGATVSDGVAGRTDTADANAGLKKYTIDMSNSFILKAKLDGASIRNNVNDVVGIALQDIARKAIKKHNAKGLAALVTGATTYTPDAADTTYFAAIVDAIKKYTVDNAESGDEPTALIISPATKAGLIKELGEKAFKTGTTEVLYKGYIGELAGVMVLESVDLPAKTEYILVGSNSFLAPRNLSGIQLIDQISGAVLAVQPQEEYQYGFAVTKSSRALVKKSA